MKARLGLVALVSTSTFGSGCTGSSTIVGPQTDVARVIVDTDVRIADANHPVPTLLSRLRVDFYQVREPFEGDPVWYASRDLLRGESSDWPASFGV